MVTDRFETACRIAKVLEAGEVFATKMPASPRQDIVDLWWSAHSAGRMLNMEVDVHTSEPITRGPDHGQVLVEVRTRVGAALVV